MPAFFRAFVRPLSLAVVGCVLVGLVSGWHPGEYTQGYSDAQVSALLHAQAVARRSRDSLALVARAKETVYVAKRTEARALVTALPPVGITGDTIVLTEGRFVAPHPVVALVVAQAHTIAVQDSALTLADTTSAAKDRVIAADSVQLAAADSLAATLTKMVPKPPGKIRSVFLHMKGPALFLAGVWIGSRAVR